MRIKRILERLQHGQGRTQRLWHEAGTVETNTVMMRQVAARGENRPLARITQRNAGGLDGVGRRSGREGAVEAGAIGLAVRQMAGGGTRVGHRQQRAAHCAEDVG